MGESKHAESYDVMGATAGRLLRHGCDRWEVGLDSFFGSVTLHHFVFGDSEGWAWKRYSRVEHCPQDSRKGQSQRGGVVPIQGETAPDLKDVFSKNIY